MSKYLELVEGSFNESHFNKQTSQNPYVAYSINDDRVIYSIIPEPVVYDPWVTFTAEEANSTIRLSKLSINQTLEYSADTTAWNTFDTTTKISLNSGDKVYVRGILSTDNTTSQYTQFKMTGKIAASGNCNAIGNYEDLEAPLKKYCYYHMFYGCAALVEAPELPATTLTDSCYSGMFRECSLLVKAPALPATTLADECYYDMFDRCKSLVEAPELPATTLAYGCYHYMFNECTLLTTVPDLSATTLARRCCENMFNGCTSLVKAPALPATTLEQSCYHSMFSGCKSLVKAPALPATTLATACYANMFKGCKSLVDVPVLPATTLVTQCYYSLFENCSSLNSVTCLAKTNINTTNTSDWLSGVSSTGTFYKNPEATDWSAGISGIPKNWTVENAVL